MQAFSFRRIFQALLIPLLAVFTALVVGAIIMLIFVAHGRLYVVQPWPVGLTVFGR